MQSVMTHNFSQVPSIERPRSSFDRSFGTKTTFDAGYLVPIYTDEVLPGDTFNLNLTAFARMSTPIFPIMDNMFLDTHFFFVPMRLVWDNSKKFFGEQVNPADSIDYTIPTRQANTTTGFAENSIADYFGLPIGVPNIEVSELYFRAYHLIYNEWFRDQNLQNSITVDTSDADILNDTGGTLLKRGKRHDYFTSCLPWPQKGDAVSLPLGTTADITRINNAPATELYLANTNNINPSSVDLWSGAAFGTITNSGFTQSYSVDVSNTHKVDLTSATASTVNDLREAFQVQRLLETDARGGTRYSELVKNHFGVSFYDVSYRPEFLGGGSTPVNVNPVATTTDGTRSVGDLGAFATTLAKGHGFTKSFVEHGIVIGLASIRADLTYQQGIPRQFLHSTRYDIYWPTLAHLGEQEVYNKEIYAQGNATDENVFGYQERYAEYRYKPSMITGALRSTAAAPLDSWHLSQEFSTLPTLGSTFIQENPPIDRVIAVPSEPHFIFDSYFNLRCARPMPVYGVPGLIDHF